MPLDGADGGVLHQDGGGGGERWGEGPDVDCGRGGVTAGGEKGAGCVEGGEGDGGFDGRVCCRRRGLRRADGFGGEGVGPLLGGRGGGGDLFLPDGGMGEVDGWCVGEEDGRRELEDNTISHPFSSSIPAKRRRRNNKRS